MVVSGFAFVHVLDEEGYLEFIDFVEVEGVVFYLMQSIFDEPRHQWIVISDQSMELLHSERRNSNACKHSSHQPKRRANMSPSRQVQLRHSVTEDVKLQQFVHVNCHLIEI